jgi:hypothetical protein
MSRVLTKAFVGKAPPDYVDAPFERKRFHKVQLWIDKHAGATPIKASVCVDGNPFFRYIGTAELNAPIELVGVPATEDYDVGVSQSRPHLVFSAPAEAGPENASGTAALTGYAFMLGFEWRGHVEVSRMLTSLLTVTETRAPICSTVPVTQSMATPTDDLMLNDFVYSSYSGVNYAGCSIPVTRS